ncbi:3',5'-cyclic AMP phosphodiesterase CpdA [Novosphingobium hassiacum]|uniref:3',5'-cyclic AMP phosphodiesterase CpdA n=1 Tax=Novosphingobium hassiacum TaxID=173676 RepID=A0A7W6EUU0_9SPHN|nr:metallophosphoesterase [Novosphingobium hassiacum]MBB3859486.1 3',5'-cyclic AMP phosphodiesterase CpdA [Novosphingobium hassiacum]
MDTKASDRIDRRGMLQCMGWAGTGALYVMGGGIASSISLDAALAAQRPDPAAGRVTPFSFLQISDSHVGFDKPANPNARGTFQEAVAKIKLLPQKPAFILHTGDITHLSKDAEFADADAIVSEAGIPAFHVPGEHDMLDEGGGKAFLSRYGKTTLGTGWYSFDHDGVHFIALVNVANLQPGGMGHLGEEQLIWLARDLAGRSASTPIVVFAHIPLWTVYADWGWGTDDSLQALSLMRRFGSVTVLNGHIHQIIQKVEGNISFHSARSTAYPQPAPGAARSPGPLKVAAETLHSVLGIRTATVVPGAEPIALIDAALG